MLPATDPLQAQSRPASPAKAPVAAATSSSSAGVSEIPAAPAFGRRGSAVANLGEREHQTVLPSSSSHPQHSSPLASMHNTLVGEQSSSGPSSRERPLTPKGEGEGGRKANGAGAGLSAGGPGAVTVGKGGTGWPTSKKGREALELSGVGLTREGSGPGKQREEVSGGASAAKMERSKEDSALAKWRKWVAEQSPEVAQPNTSPPIRRGGGRDPSPNGQTFPMNPLDIQSPHTPGSNLSPLSPSSSHTSGQPRLDSANGPSPGSPGGAPLLTSPITSLSHKSLGSSLPAFEIYNTESVLALRDVELAIDEDLIERRAERATTTPIRMSSRARLSDLPNPFVDLASRLGSRRVRPIVLELVQALGHYVDAVWCTAYSHKPCPWIIGVDESPMQPSTQGTMVAHPADGAGTAVPGEGEGPGADLGWKSPMITAVQEGKRSGHVTSPPTPADVQFWEQEVRFALNDVDEVVGIYKGVGWAFARALSEGEYGKVGADNVVGDKGEGAGMARLLNDLEEAIWGDAPPRPTDLAYDLPIGFDPYGLPDDNDMNLLTGHSGPRGSSSALTSFFSGGGAAANGAGGEEGHPPPGEEIYDVPDLYVPGEDAAGADGAVSPRTNGSTLPALTLASLSSPLHAGAAGRSTIRVTAVIPGIDRMEGVEGMTLEELGKRRHQEWVAMRRKEDEAAAAAAAKAAC